ncbi:lysophospholipid acyltransferase family protein [Methylocapsa aurea]|uniref:lysophospholipid acyltransferase family protein n=1 Tax=Methylocapsa aurea TaxID=663610 RepID=UPI00069230AC|nr:lysophospholipid acyltransferase family protein [Methylocapsa aurea]
MAYLRISMICLALIFFLLICAPLQWMALRMGWPIRLWLPILFSRTLAGLVRLKISARGAVVGPQGPRLLAANHVSWLDILALCSVEPICFLAKREVGSWPMISAFARLQETVFVDRNRRRSIPGANGALAQRMLKGRCALLFPEGTTGDGLTLRKFHSSHFAAARDLLVKANDVEAVAVQPVAIRYSSPSAAWFGDASLAPHLWSVLKGEPIQCDLVFGEPLAYERGTNRKVVASTVASAIAEMLASMAPAAGGVVAGRSGGPSFEPLAATAAS